MRDVIAHHYWRVSETLLWETVQKSLPPLKEAVKRLLGCVRAESGPESLAGCLMHPRWTPSANTRFRAMVELAGHLALSGSERADSMASRINRV